MPRNETARDTLISKALAARDTYASVPTPETLATYNKATKALGKHLDAFVAVLAERLRNGDTN